MVKSGLFKDEIEALIYIGIAGEVMGDYVRLSKIYYERGRALYETYGRELEQQMAAFKNKN